MEQALRIIQNTRTLEGIAQIQKNAAEQQRLTPEIQSLLDARAGELGREYLRLQTGLSLEDLTAAEEKIVRAASTYIGIKVRDGSNANLTLKGLRNHGLRGAAEVAVNKLKPTTGFETLSEAGLSDLSYEQIIVDHPEEFTSRALWYARRTLGLTNASPSPPPPAKAAVQEQTDLLLHWLKARRRGDGRIAGFTNADAAAALGWDNLQAFGRAYGNLQSRLDFACYRAGLPPLGLTADKPFERAWGQDDRSWTFPLARMQAAAQTRRWLDLDFQLIAAEARALPGHAHLVWRDEFSTAGHTLRAWAEGLEADSPNQDATAELTDTGLSTPLADVDAALAELADIEDRYRDARPEVRERVSRTIERGRVGALVKKLNGFKCQICEALGDDPIGFLKLSGEPYVEAHHVMPVSKREIGSLAASNVLTACPNHHRQLHYGQVEVSITPTNFVIKIDDHALIVPRPDLSPHLET